MIGLQAYIETIKLLLSLDWDFLNGGHGKIGSRSQTELYLAYMQDINQAVFKILPGIDYSRYYGAEFQPYAGFNIFLEEARKKVAQELQAK